MLSAASLGTQKFFLYRHGILWQVNVVSGMDLIDRLQVKCVLLSHLEDVGLLVQRADVGGFHCKWIFFYSFKVVLTFISEMALNKSRRWEKGEKQSHNSL